MKIQAIQAIEVLDSRGNPTVEAKIVLENGVWARAMVPSGASTGTHEALEMRDQDSKRFLGKGVLKAVANVNKIIAPKLIGMSAKDQNKLDQRMIDLDGTENKTKLGANAMLAVSMAAARVSAKTQNIWLFERVAQLFENQSEKYTMPIPMMNVLNGGKHAINSTDLQEYMIMPIGASSVTEAVRWGAEVFHVLGKILKSKGWSTAVGDEGGYAPPLKTNEEPLQLIVKAIEKAGYQPGKQVAIALDPAATEVFENGKYQLETENRQLSSKEMVQMYAKWVKKYPIVSIEDGLAEDDWQGFELMTKKLGDQVQVMGDDLYVTNPKRLQKGINSHTTNSILIKLNQIGTVSETIQTVNLATQAGMTAIVSHRSGETEDPFIADFVVGAGTGQIKTGSLSRSERLAKYNQLIRIEKRLGNKAKIAQFPFNRFK